MVSFLNVHETYTKKMRTNIYLLTIKHIQKNRENHTCLNKHMIVSRVTDPQVKFF